MKKATRFLLGIFTFSILISSMAIAQINESDGLRMPGDWNSFANSNGMGGDFDLTKISTGTVRWTTSFQFTGSSELQNFKFVNTSFGNDWGNQWAQVTGISLNTITSVPYTTNGSVGDNSISLTENNWYTVNWKDNGYAATDFIFMETSAAPISISATSVDSVTSDTIYVSITLSGSKSAEEEVFVRYSNDDFSSSKHVMANGSGTSYQAAVPFTDDIDYYILTSTVDLGSDNTTYSGDYDLATIDLENNSGSNYSYNYGFEVIIDGDAGWRLLSMPIENWTIADITDDTAIQGVTGGSDASADTALAIYDNSGEWEIPASITTVVPSGYGMALYFFDNSTNGSSELPITLDVTGLEPNADVTVDLNKSNTSGGLNHYFTLLGNPFTTNFDLNGMTVNGDGLQDNVHFWDDGSSSWVTGDRSSSYIISPWQGFFAEVSNASTSTTATFPTSGQTSSDTTATFFSKATNSRGDISFTLIGESTFDEAIKLAFRDYASNDIDRADATKMFPFEANFATMAFESNSILKSVESLPYDLQDEVTLSLQPQVVGVSGEFIFAWNGLETIPSEWELILHDYDTGESIDMRSQSDYKFFETAHAKASSNPLNLLTGPAAVAMKAKAENNRFGITISPTTSVSNESEDTPARFALEQNYPNPFNPSTTISYSVKEAGAINISVYNLMGQKVATLVNETKAAGQYNVRWNAAGAASGMYYYRLDAGGQSITRKMTLIK